jgi:hypothetical protein
LINKNKSVVEMKSFNQFCSEAIYFIEMSDFSAGGGNAKMRETGMTRDQVIALGQKNLARLKNRPAAAAPKPATPTARAVAPAPRPAAPTTRPAASPAPRPRDERPTNRQVAAARKEAEYQRNARNLRLGVELGGLAAQQARQNYATQNSPAVRAARAQMAAKNAGTWRTHQFTLDSPAPNKPKDRDYGIPDFVSDRRRENLGAMTDANVDAGMSRADAAAKARRDEAERHKRNMQYQQNRRYGYQG